jgi:hypothetical protein
MSDRSTGYQLLKDVVALDLRVEDTKIDNDRQPGRRDRAREDDPEDDPDVLATCAWGLIFL